MIQKIVDLAEELIPVALIGAGGIGKTSVALTVLHHKRIKQRFGSSRGHDVSGHIFLLTMSILFLTDQITHSLRHDALWTAAHNLAVTANTVLIGIWVFATYTTAVYFHTPFEKLTGFRTFFFPCLTSTALTRRSLPSSRYCRVRSYPDPLPKPTPRHNAGQA